ncbi:hypothetical protein OYT88_01060 [Sporolactobacillus sp. CQH2019]|jgi:hypothetical protein|uniref:hypothetical protein n=1 Tax=Sporolactobacillus sp. CQH2019 TaxID=3023512 RepID=UPI00236879D9|nr:hypothetical protein [Sporolactobacillus sp. CQH2019]MDD9147136.1 hypothetical protein [Sporolactobacillus sp. CQH2019]
MIGLPKNGEAFPAALLRENLSMNNPRKEETAGVNESASKGKGAPLNGRKLPEPAAGVGAVVCEKGVTAG